MPCPVADPHWTAFVSALGTPIIAGLVGLIAYRQWRTARDRLKLDLFDRRFEVYFSCMKFLSDILISRHVDSQRVDAFTRETRNGKWLLDQDIAEYLDKEFRRRALRHQTLEIELEPLPPGEKRTAVVAEKDEIFTWLGNQYDVIDRKFSKYLKLHH